ncbi:MAG TPA: pitrilysin family protein [Vicinamibacterales bacterium]|jgi:zinc protease|nr:pitrilysin family protein [Vicinamibacterales bacterium]
MRAVVGTLALAMTIVAGLGAAGTVTFSDVKLKNGLRVIISEDHTAPTVAIAVTYNVGSADERARRTGFAHLFEHMMFKGSENVGPGEHMALVFNNGGTMNGTTNSDRTLYFEVLPANQLELALFLEGDRMKSLDITKANLDNQRNAVQEERRLGVDNQPYGETDERTTEQAYDNFAYKHSTIGSMEDLNAATVDDVATFFKTYYAPNNAILSIVGDVDTKKAMVLVQKYFGVIATQPQPKRPNLTEAPHTAERRSTIQDPLARLARVDIAWIVPPAGGPDGDALDVLSDVLSAGRSGRLNEVLVRQKQVATAVGSSNFDARGPGLFQVFALVAPGKEPADAENAVYAEIDKIKDGKIEDWELEKARNTARRSAAAAETNTLQRAIQLGQYALFFDDPNLINTHVDRIVRVTGADVQRVARKYFSQENRSVIITTPKSGVQGGVQ